MQGLDQNGGKSILAHDTYIQKEVEAQQKQLNTVYDELVLRFDSIISEIAKNPEIAQYLQKIQVSAKDVSDSFATILKQCQLLKQKRNLNKVFFRSVFKIFKFLLQFLKTKDIDGLDSKGKTVWFLQIQTKLSCCLQFFHSLKSHEDITNSPPEAFANVWAKITINKMGRANQTKKQYKSLKNMLHRATSASINEQTHDLALIKKCSFGLSFFKYMIMNDSAKLKSFRFYRNPTLEMAQKIWNIPEEGAIKQLSKIFMFEGIKINRKIYIPTTAQFSKDTDIFTSNDQSITVRILYNKKINFFHQPESCSCCGSADQEINYIDTVLVHMHGGGFVALSSRSMQNYTRVWSKQLNIPVFSIDYRMPPDHPFPQAPQDCLIVYRFLIERIHNYMNIRPKNIYLAGESAGGNLVCSLTGLILKQKLPIPRGLYMAYPATDVRIIFSQSRLLAFTDPLLWPSMLQLCLKSYLNGDFKQAYNPLASPCLLSEEYLNGTIGDHRFPLNWPKTFITAGMTDPLLDDSLIMMQKMSESNIDCKCVIYQELSHGYLNIAGLIKQCQKTIGDSVEHLRQLIESTRVQ